MTTFLCNNRSAIRGNDLRLYVTRILVPSLDASKLKVYFYKIGGCFKLSLYALYTYNFQVDFQVPYKNSLRIARLRLH